MLTEALVIAEPGASFRWETIEVDDELRDDEALIEMKASGVCHTDLNFRKETTIPGLFPGILGHEGEIPAFPGMLILTKRNRGWSGPQSWI